MPILTITISVGKCEQLEDGDGIKLGSLNDPKYRQFIYSWTISSEDLTAREIKCIKCQDYISFSAGEQVFFKRKGFKDPLNCLISRQAKKRGAVTTSSCREGRDQQISNREKHQQKKKRGGKKFKN